MCFYVFKYVRDTPLGISVRLLEINRVLLAFAQFIQVLLLMVTIIPAEYISSSGIQQSGCQYIIMYIFKT